MKATSVRCAWCTAEIKIGNDGCGGGMMVRRCPSCTGSNGIELSGERAQVTKHRHGREDTGKIKLPKF